LKIVVLPVGVGATAVAPDIPARSIEDSQLSVGIAGVSRTSTFLMSTAQLACSVCTAALRYSNATTVDHFV
jgi:hypothetical protein